MSGVRQCLILAAGNGSRIASVSGNDPKPLVLVRGMPLLEHVLLCAREAGIEQFFVVIGYRGNFIRQWFDSRGLHGVDVTWIENNDFQRGNGVSVLQTRKFLHDRFLLLMSDHLFEPRTAKQLLRQSVCEDQVLLAVDRQINGVFDLEDATKVRIDGEYIVDIGKSIPRYDALDTGMFLCGQAIFGKLESAQTSETCSLSDGMRALARERKFRAFDIGAAHWQDVDTPEALAYAEGIFHQHFRDNPTQEMFVRV
jgi:1L-myo-inositol 1-phosphate cytidylyltransferase